MIQTNCQNKQKYMFLIQLRTFNIGWAIMNFLIK